MFQSELCPSWMTDGAKPMAVETLKLEAQCHPRAHGKQEQNGSGGGESRVVPKQPYILTAVYFICSRLENQFFYALYKGSGFLSSFLLLRHEKETLAAGPHMRTGAISDRLLDKTSDWLS